MGRRRGIVAALAVWLFLGLVQPSLASTWPCKCDINRNGLVDLLDLVKVTTAYNSWGKSPHGRGPDADVNDDGVVNLYDLVLIGRYYDQSCCLDAAETVDHVGETTCVDFTVATTTRSSNWQQVLLKAQGPFPGCFSVSIDKDLWSCWPVEPEMFFAGENLRVWGTVRYDPPYETPQILLGHCTDIEFR